MWAWSVWLHHSRRAKSLKSKLTRPITRPRPSSSVCTDPPLKWTLCLLTFFAIYVCILQPKQAKNITEHRAINFAAILFKCNNQKLPNAGSKCIQQLYFAFQRSFSFQNFLNLGIIDELAYLKFTLFILKANATTISRPSPNLWFSLQNRDSWMKMNVVTERFTQGKSN